MPTRMTAVDAQFYWMSAKVPSDEFMLYAFDGEPTDFECAVDDVRSRAQACHALTLRVEDGSPLTYPRWVPTVVEPERVRRHHLDDASWRRRGGGGAPARARRLSAPSAGRSTVIRPRRGASMRDKLGHDCGHRRPRTRNPLAHRRMRRA